MYVQHIISIPTNYENIPIIDGEFDRFEINSDFEMVLRDADTATFYHDSCNPEE